MLRPHDWTDLRAEGSQKPRGIWGSHKNMSGIIVGAGELGFSGENARKKGYQDKSLWCRWR